MAREEIRAYQNTVSCVVARYDGFVAKYMGDGVLAYFGYPRAHEDDAERAVRAGLEIEAAVRSLETLGTERLAVRIGIATGLVVVGDLVGEGSAQEQAVVGETPNLAARLQALAEPGQIVLAGANMASSLSSASGGSSAARPAARPNCTIKGCKTLSR